MGWIRRYRRIELGLIALALVVLGAVRFSRIAPEEQRAIELEAGLEQLRQLELAHFAKYGRYFDPVDSSKGLEWEWMDEYEWEVRIGREEFSIHVRADLDGDGTEGMWRIDSDSSSVRRVAED